MATDRVSFGEVANPITCIRDLRRIFAGADGLVIASHKTGLVPHPFFVGWFDKYEKPFGVILHAQ